MKVSVCNITGHQRGVCLFLLDLRGAETLPPSKLQVCVKGFSNMLIFDEYLIKNIKYETSMTLRNSL